ncbi:MAG: T9SS type A sorting domain-containing protein [Ignavibacteriae bacterium]|nr:T9SS type A sorting domain-containing protein [Ignavibacteria bacterium]MBI3364959.1 T9SS type A sorting domain-containing protein [Ignavibacteriota bacterium]
MTSIKFIVAFTCAAVLPLVAVAQQPLTWRDLTGPQGFNTIRKGTDGTFFATNGRGVVYESTDEGNSWSGILAYPSITPIDELVVNGSHVVVHLVDFSSRNPRQIFVWNNSPHSWTRIFASALQDYSSLMVDDLGVIFGVDLDAGRVFRYTQQTGWTALGISQGFLTVNFFSSLLPSFISTIDHSDRIFIGSSRGGLFISEDTAKSWRSTLEKYYISAIDVSQPDRIIAGASPSLDLHTNGGAFVSTDSGRTWTALGLEGKNISTLTSDQDGNLLALAEGDVYKYDSTVKTWVISDHLPNPFTTLLNGGGYFIASNEVTGFTRSSDGGSGWVGGLFRGRDVFSLTVTDGGNVLVGTLGSGVYYSQLGSSYWTATPSGEISDYVYDFVKTNGTVVAGTDNGVYRATDDGRSWMKTNDSSLIGPAYAVDALGDGTLFAGTLFGVFRSDDEGHHWQRAGNLSSTIFFMDISTAGDIVAATIGTGVFLSSDRGETWTSLGLSRNDIQTVKFTPSGGLMVGAFGGIFQSTNRGVSWDYHSFATTYAYTLAFAGNQTVYAGTYQGVFASSDGGTNWVAAGDSGLSTKVVLSLDVASDGSLLAGTYRGGVYQTRQVVVPPIVEDVASDANVPTALSLSQNYPNPFNPNTTIRYALPAGGNRPVSLKVFDLLGREVTTLVSGEQGAGNYGVTWDASRRASGIYFYRLLAGGSSVVRKMVIMK